MKKDIKWWQNFEENLGKGDYFEIEFTEQYIEELNEIYNYISIHLKENIIAKKLIKEVNNKVLNLVATPELYMKIGKADKLQRTYHKIIIKNYIVLYTIDFYKKKVYISHIIYGKRDYLN